MPIAVPQPVDTEPVNTTAPAIDVEAGPLRHGDGLLFDRLRFRLDPGRTTCLLGRSGVGKSTLLRLIAGLEDDAAGRIADADGRPLTGRIAYMAQQDLLLPWLGVRDNVLLGWRLRGGVTAALADKAARLVARVGLGDRLDARPDTLSGGMRQRVALVRTLMEDRPVVLMDEPFSALDAITRLDLQAMAAAMLAGRTVLLVTHDPLEALRLGHRVLVLHGRPAHVTDMPPPAGPPPRPVDAPDLLAAQAGLLRRLADSPADPARPDPGPGDPGHGDPGHGDKPPPRALAAE